MNGKECRATRREIDESELNQHLSDQARAHLAVCVSCSDFRAERASLRELVGSLEPVTAPGDFEMRLRARIASEQGRAPQPFIFRFVTSTPAIAVAALVIICVASAVWFTQRNRNESATVSAQNDSATTTQPDKPIVDAGKGQDKMAGTVVSSGNETLVRPDRTFSSQKGNPRATQPRIVSGSVDSALRAAEVIRQSRKPGEVSLNAPDKPTVFSMQDDRGMTRKFSLPPVSFGSQRLVDNRVPVSATNTRVW